MRVVVLAPIQSSLYARIIAHLLHSEDGIEVRKVIVRTPWSIQRMTSEFRRDGVRLLRKAFKKLVLKERGYELQGETIYDLAKRVGLPGKNLSQLGRLLNIPVVAVKDHNDETAVEEMRSAEPDLVVFTGGGIIRKTLLEIPSIGILNCHMGLLPSYRGMDVVEWPLLEQSNVADADLGMTVHFMDQGVDTGDILTSRSVRFADLSTFKTVRERFEPMMVELMVDTVCKLRDGLISRSPQAANDGKQYFLMHRRLYEIAEKRLAASVEKT